MSSRKWTPSRNARWMLRDARDVGRRPLLSVDVDEEVAGQAEREEVDRDAADDLVGAEVDRRERVEQRHRAAREDRRPASPSHHESSLSAARIPKKAPISIIPSRPMFTTPERSREHPAEGGEDERRRVAEHRREAAPTRRRRFELPDARRARREVREGEAEHARGDREAAEPPLAPRDGDQIPPARRAARARGSGPTSGPRSAAGRRRPPTRPSTMPLHASVRSGFRVEPAGSATLVMSPPSSRARARAARGRRMSAPTNSTTRPWIRSVRFDASSGWKTRDRGCASTFR